MLDQTRIIIAPGRSLTADRSNLVQNVSAALVVSSASILSLSALFWTVRERVLPLAANSEFFAFSWIYGLRWGAGENVFLPHSQLTLPIFSLINKSFRMTEGDAAHIISGWHSIAFYWPLALMALSLVILFSTIDRQHRLVDAVFSAAVYLASVPLFLSDFAIGSMAYHSLAIPLALTALPFWNSYKTRERLFPITFYVMLGIYAAVCLLGKPTFGAFAAPFFAIECVKSIRSKNFTGIAVAMFVAAGFYLGWLFLFYGSLGGVADHFSQSLYFMQSQAGWYDNEKGATPFHWYAGYVVGKMGPLPTILIITSIACACTRKDRVPILIGSISAIGCALFCLYSRSQLHAESEFMALLATTTVAAFRCSTLPSLLEDKMRGYAYAIAVTAIALLLLSFPLPTIKRENTLTMAEYDAIVLPWLFQQPKDIYTIALMNYPNVFWGVADAWCRGESNIFNAARSHLLDQKFGNVMCLFNQEDGGDTSMYSHALFAKPANVTEAAHFVTLSKAFPATARRLRDCQSIGSVKADGVELFRCKLDR